MCIYQGGYAGCIYQAMYHPGYTRLCTTQGIPCYVHPPYHPGYTSPVHPLATVHTPRYRTDGLTALRRTVAEVTVSEEPLTVRHPFHCWFSFLPVSLLVNVPSDLPKKPGREGGMLRREVSLLPSDRCGKWLILLISFDGFVQNVLIP